VDATGAPLAGNESITDSYAYTAFGESDLASTTGTTTNNYRFTGEQLDPNLGFYYLRARYMSPQQGRFVGMDSFMGSDSDPVSLHKFLYASANPIMYVDPTGRYTADFGRAVEDVVCDQYKAFHPLTAPLTKCGKRAYFNFDDYWQPDIMDWGALKFNEIKPASPSGVPKGLAQLIIYTAAYKNLGFTPNTTWVPMPATVDGERVYFANIGGIIFYTDDDSVREALLAATLATVNAQVRRAAVLATTRIGADAGARALINRGIIAIGAQAGRLNAHIGLAPLLRF
jgi:RHS repeat-associated protein